MSADRLRKLRALLGEALALPCGARSDFVARAITDDAALGGELRALLTVAERDDPLLEPPAATPAPAVRMSAGQRVGAWRLERCIGHGGMGEVWLASRADGAFEQRVAIKVPRAARPGPDAIARFERERALLSELEDPGVARLIDGGWEEGGRPWLAMEFVDGEAIDRHAEGCRLDVPSRVRLLLAACRALAAAHRRRIVHRDLKPGNVLVRADGHVVLVDFGIAAALDHAPAATVGHLATPAYSAPEQLRGAVATTAADVYSMARLGRGLVGAVDRDLTAVFDDAMREDPEQRTSSIDMFAADLQRWLEHRPVEARPPSAWHRLRLWRRRSPGTAAAVSTLCALTIGLGIVTATSWQAERAERARAVAANEQKDRRLAQVRALVRELVFGVHDRIATLPGAVPARAFVVEQAELHLAALAGEAADDPGIAQELIEVHLRLAEVRGARTYGHLGDLDGAMRSAQAGVTLASDWRTRQPSTDHWLLFAARAHRLVGDLAKAQGRTAEARAAYDAARAALAGPIAHELAPAHARIGAALQLQFARLAVEEGDLQSALVQLRSAQQHLDELTTAAPEDRDSARNAALALHEQGLTLSQLGRDDEAAATLAEALGRFAALAEEHRGDTQLVRDRIEVEIELALTLARSGTDGGDARLEGALGSARSLLSQDPANAQSERLLQRALLQGARIAALRRDHERTSRLYREVEPRLQDAMQRFGDDRSVRRDLAEALIGRAEADRLRGANAEVAATFRAGIALIDVDATLSARDHHAGNMLTMAWVGLGRLALAEGDPAAARERFAGSRGHAVAWAEAHEALAWPLPHLAAIEHGLGNACEVLGNDPALPLARRLEHLQEAQEAYSRGLAIADRLAAADRLRGPDKAMPKFLAMDAARVAAEHRRIAAMVR